MSGNVLLFDSNASKGGALVDSTKLTPLELEAIIRKCSRTRLLKCFVH
jgi:hypothetical protein